MKIGIANDHHGIDVKKRIINYLNENNVSYVNYGADFKDNVDYVDYALKICEEINSGNINLGILICGTGIGMSVVANKVDGIICAKVSNAIEARFAREHNGANVISIGENVEDVEKIVDTFINTALSVDERHIRRRNKISKIEENN